MVGATVSSACPSSFYSTGAPLVGPAEAPTAPVSLTDGYGRPMYPERWREGMTKSETKTSDNRGKTTPTTKEGASAAAAGPPIPRISVRIQYIKDLSFENPRAPAVLAETAEAPHIQVNVDVEAKPMSDNQYEVSLRITASGKQKDVSVFVVELVYAGLFALENIPKDRLETACLVECPRLLFPFARRVIADATREGGFPPLYLDPIDFGGLYRKHRASTTKKAAPSN